MATTQVPTTGVFVQAPSSSEWYEHLEWYGSCLRLLHLLAKKHELIHQLGPKGITVLHKGVHHGCVKLVKFILVNMFDKEGICTCKQHGPDYTCLTREELLCKTYWNDITAVNIAVVRGSPKMVLLLKWAIDKNLELTQKKLSLKSEDTYRDVRRIRSGFKREKRCVVEGEDLQRLFEDVIIQDSIPSTPTSLCPPNVVEEVVQSVNATETNLVVPNVKDDTIDQIYEVGSREMTMIPKVYSVIKNVLENPGIDLEEEIDMLKDRCKNDVNFEFVPVAHVFLQFLCGTASKLRQEILKRIFEACNARDEEEGVGRGTMLKTLFSILDPRGRTFLHVALLSSGLRLILGPLAKMEERMDARNDGGVPSSMLTKCWNVTDGAGRTILHLMCIHDYQFVLSNYDWFIKKLDWNVTLSPLCREELHALQKWCFPLCRVANKGDDYNPLHLAVIFNRTEMFRYFLSFHKEKQGNILNSIYQPGPFQVAAFLGRTRILEQILKYHKKFNSISDQGFGNGGEHLSAIHCAALSGQVEAIQLILKYPMYDPIISHVREGTALHLLVQKGNINVGLMEEFQRIALIHVLPNSIAYECVQNDFLKLHCIENEPKMYSANEISCINLLLQAGIDIWTPHCYTKDFPTPGPMANDEARKWWYDKVVSEVVILKTSISYAANATSVIAALVATGSFIGPFQPPLGYADSNGYIFANRSPVQVYLVCNSLSFFFSIASILMAVLPTIPMPKESLYDELFRSQRCLKVAALMLLISIICILISFSLASIAVVSSEWHEKQLVVACIVFGGGICVVVLVIYIIRLLRMLLHKNDRFRRWFAKHMSF